MKSIVFFGDDQYSVIVVRSLLNSGFAISAVITLPPKPVGRQQLVTDNPLAQFAKEHNLPTTYYSNSPDSVFQLLDSKQFVGVLASFGRILPGSLIAQFGESGILCLHPSLLPQYRNASPGQYAIALGDQETGVTLFRITPRVDEGEILAQETAPIYDTDTTPTLLSRLFALGSDLLIHWLTDPLAHRSTPAKGWSAFGRDKLVFTRKFTRDSGYVEWPVVQRLLSNQPVAPTDTANVLLSLRLNVIPTEAERSKHILHDLVRALTPWPGVWTMAKTSKGPLRISIISVLPRVKVQLAGKKSPISWSDFKQYYL